MRFGIISAEYNKASLAWILRPVVPRRNIITRRHATVGTGDWQPKGYSDGVELSGLEIIRSLVVAHITSEWSFSNGYDEVHECPTGDARRLNALIVPVE